MVKKILSINSTSRGSTGRIMFQITRLAREAGYDAYMAHARGEELSDEKSIKIGRKVDIYWHGLVTRVTGKHGFSSKRATKIFLKKVDEIKPDLIHLHNIHGYYLNIELLFKYIREKEIPVVWTLHDCWAFTGHCAHFDFVGCEKWKNGCFECPQLHVYPRSLLVDFSKEAYRKKKELFGSIEKMTIVTPSKWLSDLVGQSFLKHYETAIINNGVDTRIFSPRDSRKSDFGIEEGKFVILGVASKFTSSKGFECFLKIAERLDGNSTILLIGLNRKQLELLPKNIIGVERTENIKRLVEAYSIADLLVNPTLQDTFPTTNLESLACGTPVVTFRTGGSPETIDNSTGIVVEKGSVVELMNAINTIRRSGKRSFEEACRKRAVEFFSSEDRFVEYLGLYERVLC